MSDFINNKSIRGHVFDIQHFCLDDGPGIRTTVFLKGCPLSCVWCHNPESHKRSKEVMFHSDKCSLCGACALICKKDAHTIFSDGKHLYDRTKCSLCEECISICPHGALQVSGKLLTVDDVIKEVMTDKVFYDKSGGGITVSGGEPTSQAEFTTVLLSECKNKSIHTCVESCAWCSEDEIKSLIPHTDLFLIDWKISDEEKHKKYTGVSNDKILKNLQILFESDSKVILRCPLIPNINIERSHFDTIINIANKYSNIIGIDLEPYHPLGISKTKALGRDLKYDNESFLNADDVEDHRIYVQERVNIPVRISGKADK